MNTDLRPPDDSGRHPSLTVRSLGSGSSGNALLIRTTHAAILVDCGVGVRRMARELSTHGLTIRDLDALLISHEHSDHVRELHRFDMSQTPVVCTRGTARATGITPRHWHVPDQAQPTVVQDMEIIAIPVSHDASEPCGFLIRTPAGTVTVLTDLGVASGHAAEAIEESHLVVLEANHDEAMLRRGPYPVHLQRRILSRSGHLSNVDSAELLATGLRKSAHLPAVWLAHLSETNNRPKLALTAVEQRLRRAGISLDVQALPRREAGPTWQPGQSRSAKIQLTLDF